MDPPASRYKTLDRHSVAPGARNTWDSYLPLLPGKKKLKNGPVHAVSWTRRMTQIRNGGNDAEGEPKRLEDQLERPQIPRRAGMPETDPAGRRDIKREKLAGEAAEPPKNSGLMCPPGWGRGPVLVATSGHFQKPSPAGRLG
jgi:hypothetical protein